ncbi:MAG: glycoside hydrolase family 95 protein, partial [Akkermansiaceae bacterium]|jgi:alpha-L-fucosidase 2|nr:glycoside hydrolase family 95 protein [Akkermansiaceae bacterium]
MTRTLAIAVTAGLASQLGAQPLEIYFDTPPAVRSGPASDAYFAQAADYPSGVWESQAQPVGNGRLGAMVFGNPLFERIQFNESSLWTGGDNPSGGYDINEFGAYQNFGDLHLRMAGAEEPAAAAVCASGHAPSGAEDVSLASDGDPRTKWCVEHHGRPVVWQIDLGAPAAVTGYGFTSANDVPTRDPRTWTFEGSADGKTWRQIEERRGGEPFAKRHEPRTYDLPDGKSAAFRHYRLVFTPVDATHFQVAEIELLGLPAKHANKPQIDRFSRILDLSTGIHTTTWRQDGVVFTREVFASKPGEVIVVSLSADQRGKVAGSVRLQGAHGETTAAAGDSLGFAGSLPNGLRYAAKLLARCDNGEVRAEGGNLAFRGDSLTLLLTASTDYALDPDKGFRSGTDPAAAVERCLATAAARGCGMLRTDHLEDFRPLMERVALDLGAPPHGKSITERLEAYRKGAADPHLEALMFQYGRYLLISSSRGFLPANLQGLWNDSNKPAWYADYHTNINLQMNYWLAEPANLAECALPLLNWTVAMIPGSRAATVKAFGEKTPGWTMRTSVNIYGGNGWQWNLPASAWLAQHFWEHFAFSGDRGYLEKTAWPVLTGVSEFWLDHLIEKDGKLVVPKGWSPEHGPREDGVAHDQQIVWDLFTNTLEAAKALGKTDPLVARLAAAREKLLGPQVGSWGQLMEWMVERNEEKSGHRHTSHLFAVYPGRQISLSGTPEWARAAAVSLEKRGTSGDSRRSWTWPWRTALWARLGNPDKAGEMIRGLLVHNTLPNLFCTHPPFQMDGNFGITAGICETLLQSHAGEISILPAVPPGWQSGRVTGLRARGGFEVDAHWQDGKPVVCRLRSALGGPAAVRLPGNPATITVTEEGGAAAQFKAGEDGAFRFPTRAGQTYTIRLR